MKPEVVIAVVVRYDGRVLLIRRKHAEGLLRWSFPGGKINARENESTATRREVREESGVQCKTVKRLGQWHHPDSDKEISYWLCSLSNGDASLKEADRFDKIGWFTFAEIKERVTTTLFPPVADHLRGVDVSPL